MVAYECVRLYCTLDFLFLFFFFQAEDGIRDSSVTGVQTCALPICCFTFPTRYHRPDFGSALGRFNSHGILLHLWKASGAHITHKRLGLFDTHVWFQHHVCKVIGNAASALSLETPMER